MRKRLLAVFLAVVMTLALVPGTAWAAALPQNVLMDNITWTVDAYGTLTISGSGKMPDYKTYSPAPWYPQRDSINAIVISNGITSIGDYSFYGHDKVTHVSIPNSVTSIGKYAFHYCISLTGVTIPDSVTRIEEGAFRSCSKVTNITIPNSVISIGEDAFSSCGGLTNVAIPNSVTSIGDSAFKDCWSLTSVSIPGSVSAMGQYVFNWCGKLTDVIIGSGVTNIGEGAFSFCRSLTHVTIPSGVTNIGPCAFYESSCLVSVDIPNSVNCIDMMAFSATGLKDVYYAGTEEQWKSIEIFKPAQELSSATIHYGSTPPEGVPTQPVQEVSGAISPISVDFYTWTAGKYDLTVDWGWDHFKGASSSYNIELSKAGLALSAAAENSEEAAKKMLTDLGFTTHQHSVDYDVTGVDLSRVSQPAAVFGHREVSENGQKHHYFAIVVRGTTTDTDKVTDVRSIIDGFSGAGSNVEGRFEDFVQNVCKMDLSELGGSTKFFVAGHSLGGATANHVARILSGKYGEGNVFGYTFASPGTVIAPSKISYMNIHNIINKEDGWTKTPIIHRFRFGREEKFYRNDHASAFYPNYLELTGRSFNDDDAHAVETYMAYVLIKDGKFTSKVSGVCWKCPIDVEIFTKDGRLVASVKNGEVYNAVPEDLCIYVENEGKYVYFFEYNEYDFHVTGTGEGVMNYSVLSLDLANGTQIEERSFENVQVTESKRFTSSIKVADDVITDSESNSQVVKLYVLGSSGQPEKQVLPDGKGTEIPYEPKPAATTVFTDVPFDAWYYDAVQWAVENGITNGTTVTTFSPDVSCTRAQIVTLLWRAAGSPAASGSNPFADVPQGSYYYDAVLWAVSQSITTGTSATTFSPDTVCTRAQAMTFLCRAAGSPAAAGTSPFTDVVSGSYYTDAVQWAVSKGVVNGTTPTTFSPEQTCTRAQIVTLLYRDREDKT